MAADAAGVGSFPAFFAAGTGAREVPGASGQLDLPYPAGIAAGQFLLALIAMEDAVAVNVASVPSGWSQAGATLTNAAATVRYYCIQKIATGSESGNLAVPLTDGSVDVFSGGRMFSFSGASAIDQSSQALTEASNVGAALPGITPTVLNTLLVGLVVGNGSATYTPATYNEPVAEYNPGANLTIGICTLQLRHPAFSFDNGTFGTALINRARYQFSLRK